mmetsp:Transcript_85352/g.198450  ORF Transcript_85352/g.198450 Transcript_85352/m.198450 type:complete len:238 (-) Transcript_85352:113-826(-)
MASSSVPSSAFAIFRGRMSSSLPALHFLFFQPLPSSTTGSSLETSASTSPQTSSSPIHSLVNLLPSIVIKKRSGRASMNSRGDLAWALKRLCQSSIQTLPSPRSFSCRLISRTASSSVPSATGNATMLGPLPRPLGTGTAGSAAAYAPLPCPLPTRPGYLGGTTLAETDGLIAVGPILRQGGVAGGVGFRRSKVTVNLLGPVKVSANSSGCFFKRSLGLAAKCPKRVLQLSIHTWLP